MLSSKEKTQARKYLKNALDNVKTMGAVAVIWVNDEDEVTWCFGGNRFAVYGSLERLNQEVMKDISAEAPRVIGKVD